MNRKEPLYICLPDKGKELFLLPKSEVEKSIKDMEEDVNSDLAYSVIGSIKATSPGIPYLISYFIGNSKVILYDVVYANDGMEAHSILMSKKRLKDQPVNIINTLDLRKLIYEYYE